MPEQRIASPSRPDAAGHRSESHWQALASGTFVALRLLIIPGVILAFLLVALVVVDWLYGRGMLSGTFFAIALIGSLGALGGSVAAAQEGLLHFPQYDLIKRTIRLGSLQECMFGAVGAYAIFLVTPGISEEVLLLGERSFPASARPRRVTAASTNVTPGPDMAAIGAVPQPAPATPPDDELRGATGGAEKQEDKPSVDWIELIAIALVGGYAGRAIITRTMMLYVTKDDVERAKEEVTEQSKEMVHKVQQELDHVVRQRELDHKALKFFHDQADIHTPPPPSDQLLESIRSASPTIHEEIYVESRRAFHAIVNMASMSENRTKEQELKGRIAERMVPIMQLLCDLDSEERFRGCRYGLALALHLLGQNDLALPKVKDAIRISQRFQRPVPPEYERLREIVERALAALPAPVAGDPAPVTTVPPNGGATLASAELGGKV